MHLPDNFIPHFIHERHVAGETEGSFPATVLFVDLAGFTRMADAMARHGRSGAEQLAHTLDQVFRPLLHEIYSRGGFVATFAGDAFTAIFPFRPPSSGGDHALLRASEAATCIPPRVDALRDAYGLEVGVKVGLSRGRVHWGIVGVSPPYSFYFRGQPIEQAARAQAQARTGQVVAPHPLRRQLVGVPTRKIPNTPFVRLAAVSSAPTAPATIPPPLSFEQACAFLPDSLRGLTQTAEFRDIIPVFVSFRSVQNHQTINQCAIEIMSLLRRFGGHFAQIEFGDKGCLFLVLLGAPVAFEHSADRAIEFLLACRAVEWPTPWRAGAAFGIAWVGFRGGTERTEYGAIGDVMNVAARLATCAPWGEAYIADSLMRRATRAHACDTVGLIKLKGRRRHTCVYRVAEGRRAVMESEPLAAMVGRQDELTCLERILLPLFEGRFVGIVSVCGEAGAGKSRLVQELRHHFNRTRTVRVQWLTCQADEILATPLQPFRQVALHLFEQEMDRPSAEREARFRSSLRRIIEETRLAGHPAAGELANELERQESVLGSLVDIHWDGSFYEELDPKLRFENTVAAFRALLKTLSFSHPVILLVEDIHWLDEASVQFLRRLPIGLDGFPVGLLLTSRHRDEIGSATIETAPGIPHQVIELGPLDPDSIASLASDILRGPIGNGLKSELVRRSEGNPLFAEQLVFHMREERMLGLTEDGTWELSGAGVGVPGKIGEVLIARLDRLEPTVREAVQVAAVLGREFDLRVLAQMLGHPDVGERARAAVDRHVWEARSEQRYAFRHALMRDAAHEMQTKTSLVHLHQRAIRSIEAVFGDALQGHYPELVYHSHEAGDAPSERKYAFLAGLEASSRWANTEAEQYLSRALELTPETDVEERFRINEALFETHHRQGRRAAQEEDLRHMSDLAELKGDDSWRLRVLSGQSNLARARGDYATSVELSMKQLSLARACGSIRDEIGTLIAMAGTQTYQGELELAREALAMAADLAARTGLQLHFVSARLQLGLIAQYETNRALAESCYQEALEFARNHGSRRQELSVLQNLGNLRAETGRFWEALAFHEQAARLAGELGDRAAIGAALVNMGNLLDTLGDPVAAVARYREALKVYREIEHPFGQGYALGNLGMVIGSQGDHEEACRLHTEALQLFQRIGHRWGMAWAEENLGATAAALGLWEDAVRHLSTALAGYRTLHDQRGEATTLSGLAEAYLHTGDLEKADSFSSQAVAVAGNLGEDMIMAECLEHRGRVVARRGRWQEATEVVRRAAEICHARGEPHRAVGPLSLLADTLREQGDLEGAAHCAETLAHAIDADHKGLIPDPISACLAASRVFAVMQDKRSDPMLHKARELLDHRASLIRDERLRRSFLENHPVHRAVLELTERGLTERTGATLPP